ncbi:MAG TPA: cytochrome c family protein [Acidobacteriota bacterium]
MKQIGLAVLAALALPALVLAEPSFSGTKACKICHLKIHKSWAATPHATVFSKLKPEEQKSADCVGCHSVGFGQGGFDPAKPDPELQNVGCESCHGPGSVHVATMKKDKKAEPNMSKPTEATCTGCHNSKSPTFKGFDYKEALEKGVHERPTASK